MGCDIFSTGDDGESVAEGNSSEQVTEAEPPLSDESDEVEILAIRYGKRRIWMLKLLKMAMLFQRLNLKKNG
jgi:hypothetical protein